MSSSQLLGRCGSGDGVRGGPWRSGATQAATASQSRISAWNGSTGCAGSAIGASASISS